MAPTSAEMAQTLGLDRTGRHIFLCVKSSAQACCGGELATRSWEHLKARLKQLGLEGRGGIQRTKADCLRVCVQGPIAVVYPEGVWYTVMDNHDVNEIVESHLKHGQVVDRLVVPADVGR